MTLVTRVAVLFLLMIFAGCGGGGSGSSYDPVPQTTPLAITLKLQKVAVGTLGYIDGIEVSLNLPPGAVVNTAGNGSSDIKLSGVFGSSGLYANKAQLGTVDYDQTNRKVTFYVIAPANDVGEFEGEFATVNCTVPTGISVSDFSLNPNSHVAADGAVTQNWLKVIL